MARKPSERRHLEEPDNDLNLIPMMNLICLLIPFLLLSAEFIKIAVINVSSPQLGGGPSVTSQPKEAHDEIGVRNVDPRARPRRVRHER